MVRQELKVVVKVSKVEAFLFSKPPIWPFPLREHSVISTQEAFQVILISAMFEYLVTSGVRIGTSCK